MRDLRRRRITATLQAAALTAALLAGGASYGAGTAYAAPQRTAIIQTPGEASARKELRALEKTYQARIGAYALDTGTGKTVAYRAGERFPLLSTFKALAAAAVLHKARTSDPGLMNRVVTWTQDEVKPNSPETEKHVKDGMTVAELCRAAITKSDNTAGNMLLKQLGGPSGLTRYLRALKDPVSRLDRWETELNLWSPKERRDTTTPAALARDLRALTVGDALAPEDRERLNGWLRANETGDTRIRAGLPPTWTVGDKTGTGPTYAANNDVAIVWPAKDAAPVIIAIYTNRDTAGAAREDEIVSRTATILARGLGKLS